MTNNPKQIKVGDTVRVCNDTYTHSYMTGLIGTVVGIVEGRELPVEVDIIRRDGSVSESIPFMFSELEVVD